MRYVYPYYYSEFACIGKECRDTCCAGWDVDVDDETAQMYKNIPLPIGERLRDRLRGTEGTYHFALEKNKRCPFLNDANLCDLIATLGEGGLCVTCTEYPRFYADTPVYEQVDLTLSCPEAARIFFRDTMPIRYITEDVDELDQEDDGEFGEDPFGQEGYTEDDEEFYKEVEETQMDPQDEARLLQFLQRRTQAFSVIQDRTKRLEDRWNEAVLLLRDFESEKKVQGQDGIIWSLTTTREDVLILQNIRKMEVVNPKWSRFMERIQKYLPQVQEKMEELLQKRSRYMEQELERLLTYFLFRYAIDIYYHKNPDKTLLFIQRCFRIVLLLLGEKFLDADAEIDDFMEQEVLMRALLEERVQIFSRQIEHSDENVNELMQDVE